MARPSERDLEYVRRAEKMSWRHLIALWEQIKAGHTPGWDDGKALEHLVIRAFRLNKLEADYPYDVPPGGDAIEKIDGLVHLHCYTFLIECKDEKSVAYDAIAKLGHQLQRRPHTTFGCVFAAGGFTAPALNLADRSLPHRILFWSRGDIEGCLLHKNFADTLFEKYRILCKYGLTDHSRDFKDLEL